jgi:hypothetical protein
MLLLSATLLLAACGSSGKSTSQTSSSGKSTSQTNSSASTSKSSGATLSKFAACLRKNGVTLPPAGKGSASGVDTKSAQYKTAAAKCARELGGAGGLHLGGSVRAPKTDLKKIHVKFNPGKIKIHVKVSPAKIHTGLPKVEQPGTGTSP